MGRSLVPMQTAPLIPALRNGNESQREAIRGGGLAQRESVIAAIEATGGHDYTLSLAREQRAQAYAALMGLAESTYQTGSALAVGNNSPASARHAIASRLAATLNCGTLLPRDAS